MASGFANSGVWSDLSEFAVRAWRTCRPLQRFSVSLAFGFIFFLHWCAIAGSPRDSRNGASAVLSAIVPSGGCRCCGISRDSGFVYRDDAGLHIVAETEMSSIFDNEPAGFEPVGRCVKPRRTNAGLWATTSCTWSEPLELAYLNRPLSKAERGSLDQLVIDYLSNIGCAGYVDDKKAGNVRTIVPNGYLHNTFSFAMFSLFAVSLRWRRRVRAFPEMNRCATCGYDTSGLPSDVCPECGAAAVHEDRVDAGDTEPRG